MPILLLVLQILAAIAPMVAKVLSAMNESQSGGIKDYDKLIALALDQVKNVAVLDFPGDSKAERDFKKFAEAAAATATAAQAVGMVVKDREIHKAVQDAYVLWRQMTADNSATLEIPEPTGEPVA